MNASQILDRAKELVTGPRAAAYGSFRENCDYAGRVAGVSPKQAALVMIGMKLSREAHVHNEDNIVDLVGYGALLGEMAEAPDGGERCIVTVDWTDFDKLVRGVAKKKRRR